MGPGELVTGWWEGYSTEAPATRVTRHNFVLNLPKGENLTTVFGVDLNEETDNLRPGTHSCHSRLCSSPKIVPAPQA